MNRLRDSMQEDTSGEAKIYNLATTVRSIERLLTRAADNDSLLEVKIKLIEKAIAAGRSEIRTIEGELSLLKLEVSSNRDLPIVKMIESLDELDNLLEMLTHSLHRLNNEAQ